MEPVVGNESMDLSKLKVPELKKELKLRNLSIAGNKNDLLERLQEAFKPKATDQVITESEDLDEDLLNDDDDEHIDENESVLNDLDSPVEVPVSSSQKTIKRKSGENLAEESPKQAKKIILSRSIADAISDVSEEVEETEPSEEKSSTNGDEKKVIKWSELSAKERLEMRAKKFGVPLSTDAKKEVRAARFNAITSPSKTGTISTNVSTPVDVLKQRAARFGVSSSTTLTKAENQERLDKRKERFGMLNGTNLSEEAKSKAQQRLERFKQPVK